MAGPNGSLALVVARTAAPTRKWERVLLRKPFGRIMPRIRVEALKAGLSVAADVRNIDGMLLIPSGATLGERQIGILQAWGVSEIEVEACESAEDSADPLAKLPPEMVARLIAETKAPFWEADETDPAFAEVFQYLLLRRVRKLTEH